MEIHFLGTGTSHGIPVIGCRCAVCRSRNPRDKRSRASILIKEQGAAILVDAGPELRQQLLLAGIDAVTALLLTHAHADHIAGLDDVRIFSEREEKDFPIFGSRTALQQVRRRFDYVFRNTQKGGGKPRLALHAVQAGFCIEKAHIIPIPLWHGRIRVMGYRIRDFAYLTDVSRIPAASYPLLRGLSVLVLDALRPLPHETHFHLSQAVSEAKRIGARRTFFTHMCHLLGHTQTERHLPPDIKLAYDGLTLRI
ncbi:MBL fold metallo-hydrolase [candidate division FCPU426 bacterium]|nr:MBL fold metallo-hydrolase [candidate division FCPU426 bacterium]